MSDKSRIPDTLWTRQCRSCDRVLPTFPDSQFYKAGDGYLRRQCKECWDRDPHRLRENFNGRYREYHGRDPHPESELIDFAQLLELYPHCNNCRGEFGKGDLRPSLDHDTPVSDPRSSHTLPNVRLLHIVCQKRKGVLPPMEAAMRTLEDVAGVRRCSVCGRSKILSEFRKRGRRPDGSQEFTRICKECPR